MTDSSKSVLVLGAPSAWRDGAVRQLAGADLDVSVVETLDAARAAAAIRDLALVVIGLGTADSTSFALISWLRERFTVDELPIVVVTEDVILTRESSASMPARFVEARTNLVGFVAQRRIEPPLSTPLLPVADGLGVKDSYCPACKSLLLKVAPAHCGRCGEARPLQGWPRLHAADRFWLGRHINGRYLVVQPLGAGTQSEVFRAVDLYTDADVAVKIVYVDPSEVDRGPLIRNMLAEMRTTMALHSPHIVPFTDLVLINDGTVAMVMPLIEGDTLEHRIAERGRLAPMEALNILFQLVSAVKAAHDGGVLHRDIKPANVMLEAMPHGGDFVRLLDFGVCTALDSLGEAGGFMGTPTYAAPEIARGEASPSSDIYALGCLFFEMLIGNEPFAGTTMQVIMLHISAPVPSLIDQLPTTRELAIGIQTILDATMAKNPRDRFESADEMLEALEEIFELASVSV